MNGTEGFYSTAIGSLARSSAGGGSYNTASGEGSLEFNTEVNDNTAAGAETLKSDPQTIKQYGLVAEETDQLRDTVVSLSPSA